MNGSLYLGKIAGIKLFIHWTFAILIGWIFIMHFRAGNSVYEGFMGVAFILSLFVCVTLHEFGHALSAKRFHYQTESITLLPIGGLAQMKELPEKPMQELWVAIAGPLVNVSISVLLFLWLKQAHDFPRPDELLAMQQLDPRYFLFNLFLANIILAVFNLIPAFPMDGGRVLRALLSLRYPRARATSIAARIGQFLAILFVFIGVFSNVWLVFIGIFIFLGAGAESNYEKAKSVLLGYKVRDIVMHNFTTLDTGDPLQKAVHLLLNGQEKEFIVTESEQVSGILSRNEIIKGLSDYGKDTPVGKIMKKEILALTPNMNIQEVYQKMTMGKHTLCPVIENGKLTGLLDKENIEELLMLNEAIIVSGRKELSI